VVLKATHKLHNCASRNVASAASPRKKPASFDNAAVLCYVIIRFCTITALPNMRTALAIFLVFWTLMGALLGSGAEAEMSCRHGLEGGVLTSRCNCPNGNEIQHQVVSCCSGCLPATQPSLSTSSNQSHGQVPTHGLMLSLLLSGFDVAPEPRPPNPVT